MQGWWGHGAPPAAGGCRSAHGEGARLGWPQQQESWWGAQQDSPTRAGGLLALPPADYPTPPPAPRSFEAEGSPSRSQVVSVHRRLIYVIPLHAPVSPSPAPSRFPPAPEMSARHCAARPAAGCLGASPPALATISRPWELPAGARPRVPPGQHSHSCPSFGSRRWNWVSV